MVGEIRQEVGEGAVALNEDPVLLVAEIRSPKPGRPLRTVDQPASLQRLEEAVDGARFVEGAFGVVQVHVDAEPRQVLRLFLAEESHRFAPEVRPPLVRRERGENAGAGGVSNRQRHVADVLAVISAFGNGYRPAGRFVMAGLDGFAEELDLAAGVVHVELARHLVSGPLQQRGDRVAERRAATVSHVQRPRRIGGDELHVDAERRRGPRPSPVSAGLDDLRQPLPDGSIGEPEVEESRARDFHLRDAGRLGVDQFADARRERGGGLAQSLCKHERRVGSPVSVRRVPRPLQSRREALGSPGGGKSGCERLGKPGRTGIARQEPEPPSDDPDGAGSDADGAPSPEGDESSSDAFAAVDFPPSSAGSR